MREPHPLAGKKVKLQVKGGTHPDFEDGSAFRIEDWWQNVYGQSWMYAQSNPAALKYAVRSAIVGLPLDNEVVYGKVDHFGLLIHITELGDVID